MKVALNRFLEGILGFLMILMVVNVLWQVFSRYILNDPSTITDELSRYLLIWVGILGAAYGAGRGVHVSVDLLKSKLEGKRRRTLLWVIQGCTILFAVVILIVGGTNLVMISFELGQTSSAMKLPLGYVYLVLPLSGLIICYYSIWEIVHLFKTRDE